MDEPLFIWMLPPPVASESELRTTLSLLLVDEMETPLFTIILLYARRVSVALAPAVLAMLAATVMSPSCAPAAAVAQQLHWCLRLRRQQSGHYMPHP